MNGCYAKCQKVKQKYLIKLQSRCWKEISFKGQIAISHSQLMWQSGNIMNSSNQGDMFTMSVEAQRYYTIYVHTKTIQKLYYYYYYYLYKIDATLDIFLPNTNIKESILTLQVIAYKKLCTK